MARHPSKSTAMTELGVAGGFSTQGYYKQEEFLPALQGSRAIRKFREMRENDPIIGATLTAMDMLIRAVEWKFEGGDERGLQFAQTLFDDMEGTFEDFLSEVLTFLPFGFSFFEVVYKRRMGTSPNLRTNYSKHSDGLIGIRKLAPRAQWTIDRFDVAPSGDILGAFQSATHVMGQAYIPMSKALLFRTTSINNDPFGRSVLRNAYLPYYYASHLQTIEAIAIEREMNGMPVGKVPSEYLAENADESKKRFVTEFARILRDVRFNEQGYIILPSDPYVNENGTLSNAPKVSFELTASKGTRDIDIDKVIRRHQHNIARTVLADFIMLGQSDRGSFALSQSKTDLFLRSIEGFIDNITSIINRELITKVWMLNGFDLSDIPQLKRGRVSPVNLEELGRFVARLAGANGALFSDDTIITDLLDKADIKRPKVLPQVVANPDPEGTRRRPTEAQMNGNDGDRIAQEGSED